MRVWVDAKRRPTLPQSLLDAAGVGAGADLIAHLEGPGRIVLATPGVVLAALQEAVRTGAHARETDAAPTEAPAGGEVAAEDLPGEVSAETGGGSEPAGAPAPDASSR